MEISLENYAFEYLGLKGQNNVILLVGWKLTS